jgi:hypothetical protein
LGRRVLSASGVNIASRQIVWQALPKGASQGVPMGELGAAGIINLIVPPYLLLAGTEDVGVVVAGLVVAAVVGCVVVVITGAAVVVGALVVVWITAAVVVVEDVEELQPLKITIHATKITRGTNHFLILVSSSFNLNIASILATANISSCRFEIW